MENLAKYKKWNILFWISLILSVPLVVCDAELYFNFLSKWGINADIVVSILIPATLISFCIYKRDLYEKKSKRYLECPSVRRIENNGKLLCKPDSIRAVVQWNVDGYSWLDAVKRKPIEINEADIITIVQVNSGYGIYFKSEGEHSSIWVKSIDLALEKYLEKNENPIYQFFKEGFQYIVYCSPSVLLILATTVFVLMSGSVKELLLYRFESMQGEGVKEYPLATAELVFRALLLSSFLLLEGLVGFCSAIFRNRSVRKNNKLYKFIVATRLEGVLLSILSGFFGLYAIYMFVVLYESRLWIPFLEVLSITFGL